MNPLSPGGKVHIGVHTDVTHDSRNYGLLNSIFHQSFSDTSIISCVTFGMLLLAILIGADINYVLFRTLNQLESAM